MLVLIDDLLDLVEVEIVPFEVGTVVDDAGSGFSLEAALPGWDEGGGRDHFAGGVDLTDEGENFAGDGEVGGVHSSINAGYAVIVKSGDIRVTNAE